MSRDDSKVQLKSLEQVLRLGQSIAAVESNTHINNSNVGGGVVANDKNTSPERRKSSPEKTKSPAKIYTRLNLMANNNKKDDHPALLNQENPVSYLTFWVQLFIGTFCSLSIMCPL